MARRPLSQVVEQLQVHYVYFVDDGLALGPGVPPG